jgi:hypothetical protein
MWKQGEESVTWSGAHFFAMAFFLHDTPGFVLISWRKELLPCHIRNIELHYLILVSKVTLLFPVWQADTISTHSSWLNLEIELRAPVIVYFLEREVRSLRWAVTGSLQDLFCIWVERVLISYVV